MTNPTLSRLHGLPILALLLLGLVAMSAIVVHPAAAEQSDACERALQRASRRGIVMALKCTARARRVGDADAGRCLARASALLMAAGVRAGADCAPDASSAVDTVDACLAAVLTEVPGVGRCPARKIRAVAGAVRTSGRARTSEPSRVMCRGFQRAGDCAGNCEAVGLALENCAARHVADPPVGTIPTPAPDDVIVAFGSYEGDAISTATMDGQDGVTHTGRVVVEPGSDPLYIVLSAYDATIWRFEGDTARVRKVVLLGYGRQGATGLAADRVVALNDASDLPRWSDVTEDGPAARVALERALGRKIDAFAASYEVGTLAVPSLAVTLSAPSDSFEAPPGFDPWVYLQATWFSPGGVVDVDPGAVVPAGQAEPYGVLPQAFGLAQLVSSGELEAREGYFYIAAPIARFPAGLHGAHSVSFVLGRGIPLPDGDPGHSCVVSEETGLPMGGMLCSQIPPTPAESCPIPPPATDDRVILFGAYEADAVASTAVAGQDETTGTARVLVEPGAEPLYVVLSAFDSTIWRFEGVTSRVRRVVLTGTRGHGVTGVTPDRVTDLSRDGGDWQPSCVPSFWDAQSPDGIAARGIVERSLGQRVDVFAAQYEVGSVSLPSATVELSPPALQAPPGLDPDVYRLGTWFSPGGVVDVDPAVVSPPGTSERYIVLPQGFGLAQLVASGHLELHGDASAMFPTFYIARAIPRFPAGLYGAHSVQFILGAGVPMPLGSAGHSCVISEETGLPLGNDVLCFLDG